MPIITVIALPGPAILAITRPHDGGHLVVLVDAGQPWRRILNVARPLLARHERRELARVLLA
jgi:hypothetical protein